MAILFDGEVKVMLNRHNVMGDGIALHFPEFLIFHNTANKYSLQFPNEMVGMAYESVADAYIAAQVKLGKLKLEGDMYVPTDKNGH